MPLAIVSDAFIACVCAFCIIYVLSFLSYCIFAPKRAAGFSLNRFFDKIRSFYQEEER